MLPEEAAANPAMPRHRPPRPLPAGQRMNAFAPSRVRARHKPGALPVPDPASAEWGRPPVFLGYVGGPVVHQLPTPIEQIATPVRGLDSVAVDVRKRQLAHRARCVGALRCPVAEAGPKADVIFQLADTKQIVRLDRRPSPPTYQPGLTGDPWANRSWLGAGKGDERRVAGINRIWGTPCASGVRTNRRRAYPSRLPPSVRPRRFRSG